MNWFTISGDEEFAQRYTLNLNHKWKMPGVKCHVCGFVGATVSAVYPRVLLHSGIAPKPYKTLWPVTTERIAELTAPIRPLIPSDLPFGAGSEFGPLSGKCGPRKSDFPWTNYHVPLVSLNALDKLRNRGITNLKVVDTEIQMVSKKINSFDFLEFEMEPRARIDPSFIASTCGGCSGRDLIERKWDDEDVPILRNSIPVGVDLVSVYEAPRWILASEAFFDAVQSLSLTGMTFEEANLS